MKVDHLDHLVLTVQDVEYTCAFYHTILEMDIQNFGDDRKALRFGNQKINLHQKGKEIDPKAAYPTPGSADLCFISPEPIEGLLTLLSDHKISIEQGGIVQRTGATGLIRSVYFRDPDMNLIEVSNYVHS
jgi:catechol 2,3-dioxygenase-like lactoylglutathione lyase family enzyme